MPSWGGCGEGVVRGKAKTFVVPANARQHCFAFTGIPFSIACGYQLYALTRSRLYERGSSRDGRCWLLCAVPIGLDALEISRL
jgi:hypothetical protein